MFNDNRCPICDQPGRVQPASNISTDEYRLHVDCPYCGRFTIALSIIEDLPADADAKELKPFLSAYIRQSQQLTSGNQPFVVPEDWKEHARAHASTPMSQRMRRLREIIAERSLIGGEIYVDEREIAPLIDARSPREVRFYLDHLKADKQIFYRLEHIDAQKRTSSTADLAIIKMELAGWESVSPAAGTGLPGTCFVAMSFNKSLNAAYEEGILPAVETDCGFDVIRIDRVEHNEDITDRILAGIRTSHFVVADFTGQRHGVYFEAGFAAGLGRTVIWTCHAKDFAKLHFDTRQRNHIKWSKPADLREQLANRIRATVTLPAKLIRA